MLPLASPPHAHQDSVELAAARLFRAARDGLACAPVRELIGADDTELAYRVQRELTRRRVRAGARIVGRKVGLTARSVQDQLGVDRPDFGVLFDDMRVPSHEAVPTQRLIQPKAEAEVAFILAQDLDVADLDMSTVRASVRHAVAAIEIVDSRIADWDISFGDTVADNASSGLFVLGDHPASLDEFEPRNVTMTMTVNGAVVSSGSGRDCLGDPLEALAWLARTAVEIGDPLRAGQIVLSGALGPMRPVGPGDVVQAYVTGLGEVTARFSAGACA